MSKKSNIKIVLYFPRPFSAYRPAQGAPLPLLAISSLLEREGHDIIIVNSNLYEKPTEKVLESCENATCLGITSMTGYQITDGLKMAKLVKERYSGLPIVWGGRHPTIEPEGTIKSPYVDILVRGQGERPFTELVHTLAENKPLSSITGVSYKSDGETFHNPERQLEDINNFPSMPYHLIDVRKSFYSNAFSTRVLNYVSSYGCPWRCGFCSEQTAWKRKWFALKADRMAEEIEKLVKDYGVDTISFYDSNFFVDMERVRLFCEEIIRRKLKIKWCDADIRISQLLKIEKDMWDLIVKSGCEEIFIGIESGYQPALDFMQKDMRVEEIIAAFEKYQNSPVKFTCTVMGGLPWDADYKKTRQLTDIDLEHTVALAEKITSLNRRNRIVFWLFTPYPGCSLFRKSVEIGLKPPDSLEKWGNWLCELKTTPWVSPGQAKKFEMVNYILFFLDPDSSKWLSSAIRNRLLNFLFKVVFKLYRLISQLRWKFHFFVLPVDYWLYQYIRKRQRFV